MPIIEENPIIICACGCGETLKKLDKYGRSRTRIFGHSTKNLPRNENWREKISKANKGRVTWSKGLGINKKYNSETGRKHRRIMKEIKQNEKWTCNKCGRTELNSRAIQVHHIDGNIFNNNKNNIEVLCVKCHISYHKKIQYQKYQEVCHSNI